MKPLSKSEQLLKLGVPRRAADRIAHEPQTELLKPRPSETLRGGLNSEQKPMRRKYSSMTSSDLITSTRV